MARLRQNFMEGVVDDAPLTIGATTLNSTELASLVAVAGPDILAMTLDPAAVNGAPEIIHVTAHTAGATSATILRGQEGTAARAHPAGTEWEHNITVLDFDYDNLDDLPTLGVAIEDEGTPDAQALTLNFIGDGVSAVVTGDTADITIPGSSGPGIQMDRNDRTAGNLTLNSTSWANVDTGLDIVFAGAVAGDWVEVGIIGVWGTEAVTGHLDVVSMVAGSPAKSWGSNGNVDPTGAGVRGWTGSNASTTVPATITGTVIKQLEAADIDSGSVTIRLRYRTGTAASKTLFATAANLLTFFGKYIPA